MIKSIGRSPDKEDQAKIAQSPHYFDGKFKNIEPTEMMLEDVSYIRMLLEFSHRPKLIKPSKPLPSVKTNLQNLESSTPAIVWFGHSSYFLKYKNFSVLVDPVLFGNASPVPVFGYPFKGATPYKPEDIPVIDLLLLTHDHYDHLSYETLIKLKNRVRKIIVPLGVGADLRYWGFNPAIITELDWDQKIEVLGNLSVTATTARHFSGRFLVRNKTLWTSYVLDFFDYKIFVGGDSGYGKHFAEIGKTHGPFDLAMLECGQYGKNWPYIHMFPEQTAQAAVDLKTKVLFPVHWAKFILSVHPWNEPVKRLLKAAEFMHYEIVTPKIGEAYEIGLPFAKDEWWNFE